jgi:hypothetical protein
VLFINGGAKVMDVDSLPRELFEALRDLEIGGMDADIAPAMIQILEDQGLVQMLDGVPTVTRSGLKVLRQKEKDMPPFL